MAGYRLTLRKLAKKYGVDIKGATYTQVIQAIVQDNVARASKKMGSLSNRRMKKAFADSIKDGIVELPEYAIPDVTVRKGAEDGQMITDTLRDVLTRGLRKAITDNPNDTEQAIDQMQQSIKDTFNTYTTSHAKMIAVTEVRSSVDLSKAEYVRELIARNPNRLRVTKRWIHHDHLVKVPRPTHKAIDGERVLFNQPFSIGLMYPHDPNAPASEVIGCQCGYQIEVEEMAINEAWKSLYQNLKVYKSLQVLKAYEVGHVSTHADGSKWQKQNDGSWKPYQGGQNDTTGVGTTPKGKETGDGQSTDESLAQNKGSGSGGGSDGNAGRQASPDLAKRIIGVWRDSGFPTPIRCFANGVAEISDKTWFARRLKELKDKQVDGFGVSEVTEDDLKDCRLFSSDGYTLVAVRKDGYIQSVVGDYRPKDNPNRKSSADALRTAKAMGGDHLECYGWLVPFYSHVLGFKVTDTYDYDPSLAPKDVAQAIREGKRSKEEATYNEMHKSASHIPVEKASASINPATGKPYQIGEEKVRPDGSRWVKTGTYSWAKAGTKDAQDAKKKTDTDSDGKKDWQEIEGQSSKDAEDIIGVYGEKGLYQLTKGGLLNLLHAHGVDDPKSLKWSEKVDKFKEIVKELQEGDTGVKIKTEGKQEFTEQDMHILHNTDLVGDVSRLENETVHTRNGDVVLKYTEDGLITDQCYDELIQKIDPIKGGHWGSANTTNDTALSVALVNAPDWKPIDKMQNGQLAKYDQQLSDGMYMHSLIKGLGLRKYAQEKLKHPDMSRENVPNFYRGMTVDAEQYEQILAGEVDTIELTGCTAVTSFEEVADQYASSSWTKGFGADRRSIKLIIERDDYMDNSIGMFHHNTKGYAHGNENIAFELLTGSPSFYIKSVQEGGSNFDIDKSADAHIDRVAYYNQDAKEQYNKIKDIDLASIYNPNAMNLKYNVEDDNGDPIFYGSNYLSAKERMLLIKAQSEVQDLNGKIKAWEKQFYKDNIQDFFSKIKNGRISHANNDKVREEWKKKVEEAWQKSDLYKQYSDIKDTAPDYYPIDRSLLSDLELPDEAERKKIDQSYSDPKVLNYYKGRGLLNPVEGIGSTWSSSFESQFERWRDAQKKTGGRLTMKMFLDKRKPLEKSYKAQVDKTEKEYKDYDGFYKWRNQVMQGIPQARERVASEIKQEYGLTDDEMEGIINRYSNGEIISFNPWNTSDLQRLSAEKRRELSDHIRTLENSVPKLSPHGITFHNEYGRHLDPASNPFVSDELKKSPYFTKNEEYPVSRYDQLANMRKNYENAKRENELIAKYNIYNTPKSEIQSKYDESQNRYNDIKGAMNKYVADKWLKKQGWDLENLSPTRQEMRDSLYRGSMRYLSQDERDDYDKLEKDVEEKDKEYQKLKKQREEEETLNSELVYALGIYGDYASKLADMHKSSKPLEVYVVCGRGKKSITTGPDDQLEDDNGDNQ